MIFSYDGYPPFGDKPKDLKTSKSKENRTLNTAFKVRKIGFAGVMAATVATVGAMALTMADVIPFEAYINVVKVTIPAVMASFAAHTVATAVINKIYRTHINGRG